VRSMRWAIRVRGGLGALGLGVPGVEEMVGGRVVVQRRVLGERVLAGKVER
jgi:hypothetical protein